VEGRKPTLIAVRRSLVEPNAALAGVMFETFVGFRASMASLSGERALSRPFGCWNLAAMVETQGSCGVWAVRKNPNPDGWASIPSSRASYERTHLVKRIAFAVVSTL